MSPDTYKAKAGKGQTSRWLRGYETVNFYIFIQIHTRNPRDRTIQGVLANSPTWVTKRRIVLICG